VFDYTATVLKKLEKAQAPLIGKLAMVELAGGPTYSSPGASATGPGLNPWNRGYWSGGSSSGSGAAVAAGLVPFALGSETSGSILTPAAFCGITGLRPTFGLVSRFGAMELSRSLDKIGPMCRTAEDCGIVLQAIAGGDSKDPFSAGKGFYFAPQFARPLSQLRVGYAPADFDVVAISFDPRDNDKPDLAKNKKLSYLEHYGRPGTDSGWHFLTGSQESIKAVTDAAGFKYEWDDKTQQFAHAAAVMVVTPEGKMSRYFYGIDYAPKDIKFGIMDSAQAKVGNPAEQLLLYCYHYDPASGKYGFAILRVMRLAGVATLLGLGAMAFVFWRKNKNNGSNNGQSTAV